MSSISTGADSLVFGTNLTIEELSDDNNQKGKNIGDETIVKCYLDLSKEAIKQYHKIHNDFRTTINGDKINISGGVIYEGIKYNKALIEVIELENNFIEPLKLLTKIEERLDIDALNEFKVLSLQKYVKGETVKDITEKLNEEFYRLLTDGLNPLSFIGSLDKKDFYMELGNKNNELEKLQKEKNDFQEFITIQLFNYIMGKFNYARPSGMPQITIENIKIIPLENGILKTVITDIGGDIKHLLDSYEQSEVGITNFIISKEDFKKGNFTEDISKEMIEEIKKLNITLNDNFIHFFYLGTDVYYEQKDNEDDF